MGWPESAKEWFELAELVRVTAIKVVETASQDFRPALGLKDPLVFAVTIVSRTVESNKAAFLLARQGFLVEAAMVARSCLENVLWMRALASAGVSFCNEILADGDRADASIAERIKALGPSSSDEARQAIEGMIARKTKTRIELEKLVSGEDARTEYLLFRMISNQYAHVSRSSLLRHIDCSVASGPELAMQPTVKQTDLQWVMFFAATSVINATHLLIMTFPEGERHRFVLSGDERALQHATARICFLRDQSGMGESPEMQ